MKICHFVQNAVIAYDKMRPVETRIQNAGCDHSKNTETYLQKLGITINDLDRLSVIHITGTKGKVRKNF